MQQIDVNINSHINSDYLPLRGIEVYSNRCYVDGMVLFYSFLAVLGTNTNGIYSLLG